MLRGQSAHSSWFFVETARIGDINANVTIALTSSILAARHGGVAPEISSGLFRRFIGTSGFQLINVNNVPLSLRGWTMDTRLIGRKALTNSPPAPLHGPGHLRGPQGAYLLEAAKPCPTWSTECC